jgi:hypothetical protein
MHASFAHALTLDVSINGPVSAQVDTRLMGLATPMPQTVYNDVVDFFPNATGGKTMTMKKTLRVPLAADGIPLIVHPQELDKTRELPAVEDLAPRSDRSRFPAQAAPKEIVDDEITVPVQSSIESTLTYELLRRQSTVADEDEE